MGYMGSQLNNARKRRRYNPSRVSLTFQPPKANILDLLSPMSSGVLNERLSTIEALPLTRIDQF